MPLRNQFEYEDDIGAALEIFWMCGEALMWADDESGSWTCSVYRTSLWGYMA